MRASKALPQQSAFQRSPISLHLHTHTHMLARTHTHMLVITHTHTHTHTFANPHQIKQSCPQESQPHLHPPLPTSTSPCWGPSMSNSCIRPPLEATRTALLRDVCLKCSPDTEVSLPHPELPQQAASYQFRW